jgi:transcription-repair coupling factor (superfamily II helicase)
MEQVGYDTYCKLLDEVIKEMQGIAIEEEKDIQIDLQVSCYIPDEYINNNSQKIEIYQDIALCKTEEDIQNVIDEIIDRYRNYAKRSRKFNSNSKNKGTWKKSKCCKNISKERRNSIFI